jgi:hypothetical protein
VLKLDESAKTATFVAEHFLGDLVSGTQGNMQTLSNGNAFMGWGQQPFFSEYSKTGKLLMAIGFPKPDISYRAYRYVFHGHPAGRPAAAVRASGKNTRVYVSWNGATDIASYQVFTGKSSKKLKLAKKVRRGGFETAVTVRGKGPAFRVKALDANGKVLGTSAIVVRTGKIKGTPPAPVY